jgi:polar amino acid transport system substrate-binding protein
MTTAGARITAGALLAAGLMLAGCSGDSGDAGEQGDAATAASVQPLRTITPGTLTVCSDIPYEPFDVMRRGTFTGFDGDLVQEIAAGLDLELRVKRLGFEALQSGLALSSDRCDLVASAMGITEAREQKLDFTDGYFAMELALLVRAGSDIAGLDGVAGRMVGVLQGSRGKTYAEDNAPSEATIVSFPSDAEMVRALFAREVDAVVHDLPVALGHADGGAFDVVESYPTDGEEYGFGVKEGNTALRDAVNEQLERLREDGTYQAIYDEYFAID